MSYYIYIYIYKKQGLASVVIKILSGAGEAAVYLF